MRRDDDDDDEDDDDDDNFRRGEPPRRSRRESRDESRGESRRRSESRSYRLRRRRGRPRDELPMSDLRSIAFYQKALILCIMAMMIIYFGAIAAQVMAGHNQNRPPPALIAMQVGIAVAMFATAIASTVFVFLLATKTYNVGVGILLGILTLIPCIGLIVLLIINSQATSILRSNGVRVGFIGASKNDLDDLEDAEKDDDED
jgi:hypothetical protein